MSVHKTTYVMYGVDVGYDNTSEDIRDRAFDGELPFDMVVDGMGGKYAVAGKIIAKSDRDGELDFVDIKKIYEDSWSEWENAVQKVQQEFIQVKGSDFTLFVFTHFS